MRLPIGFLICEWNDLLHCEQNNTDTEVHPIYEDDYVDAMLDHIAQHERDATWEVYATIVWVDTSEVAHVGYLDKVAEAS